MPQLLCSLAVRGVAVSPLPQPQWAQLAAATSAAAQQALSDAAPGDALVALADAGRLQVCACGGCFRVSGYGKSLSQKNRGGGGAG